MYWTGSGRITSTIERANLDGSEQETLLIGLFQLGSVALDVAGGKMYWTDSLFRIERANLDGSGRETLISLGLINNAQGIALDLSVAHDVWVSSNLANSPFEPFQDCLHFNENTMFTAGCGDQAGPLSQFPLFGIGGLQLWIGQIPCQSQNLLFIGTSFAGESLPFGGNAIAASIIGLSQGITLGLEGFETTEGADVPASQGNPYAAESAVPTSGEPSEQVGPLWSQGNPPTLQLGPLGAAQTVANKTYEVWFSQSVDPPPFEPMRDCVRFTDTTLSRDACGDIGALAESPLLGVPGLSLWIGHLPCGGLSLVYFGTSFDGAVFPFGDNVMSTSVVGLNPGFTLAVEGFENPSCSIVPGTKGPVEGSRP